MRLVYPGNGLLVDSTEKFWVGWHIKRAKGWHTYWEYPGDVGVPPSVQWNLPIGCQAERMVLPPPVRVSMAGISAYGYLGETLFLIPISLTSFTGNELSLKGSFFWMACSSTCLPATTQLTLSIPVVKKFIADPYLTGKFEEFWDRQPQDLPNEWNFQAHSVGKFINLQFPQNLSPLSGPIDFYAEKQAILSNQTPQIRKKNDRFEWLLKKPPWKKSSPDELSGLLAIGQGERRVHYRLKVPITETN